MKILDKCFVYAFSHSFRNLPQSIMIGIPLTTIAYVLANIGYFAVMSKEEVLLSHAVAVVCHITAFRYT